MTKRLIISVESSSMEIWISPSTGSSQALRRARVVPDIGSSKGCPATSAGSTNFLLARGCLPGSRQVIQNSIHHARAVGPIHRQLHIRKFLLVFGKHHRQHVDTSGFVGGDDKFAARNPFQFVNSVLRPAPQIEDLLGVAGEDFAGGGESDFGSQPFKQRGIELLFELPHLCTDSRLGTITRLRRFRKAFQADYFKERMQLIEIHWGTRKIARLDREVCINCTRSAGRPG